MMDGFPFIALTRHDLVLFFYDDMSMRFGAGFGRYNT
jgi:hypothetical protein